MNQDANQIKYLNYNRKSTTDERQILSLPSQEEAMKEIANKFSLKIIATLKESKSAKEPNKRPVFNDMIRRIKAGEANGIACWELSRLARNPDEAGLIIGMLQRGEIKHIKTYGKDYYSDDNSVISFVEFGIANQFSRDLSRNVKRGLDKKVSVGWRPGKSTLGYCNSKTEQRGEQYIFSDPDRFDRVKQVFQTMLTGNYTVPKLLKYANEELELRLPASGKRPSRKIQLSEMYRILSNPFYYGWYEWTTGSGNWIQGKHEPMITEKEFDQIQFLLGRKGRPRPKEHKFAFTGLMKCGNCGAAITAEEKFKKQKNGNVHHYIYYHCTRKKNPNCVEKSLELKEFNRQVDKAIEGLTIPERFQKWALTYLHELRTTEANSREQSLSAKQNEYERITKQIDNLVLTYTSVDNANEQMMTKQQLMELKSDLLKQKSKLETELNSFGKELEQWVELSERTFNFARYARIWFTKGDVETKRAIFACLGSDLILKDQKVAITLQKPFQFIFDKLPLAVKELERLEPLNIASVKAQLEHFKSKFPLLSG